MRMLIASFAVMCGALVAHAECGSRGGPAFRKPDDQCASWKDVEGGKCRTPPIRRCTLACGGIGATRIAKATDFIAKTMPGTSSALAPNTPSVSAPAGQFNKRAMRADGIACSSQNILASAASCLIGRGHPNCNAAVEPSFTKGDCSRVTAGTEARIEAGSYSFEWVRVRILNRPWPLWVERQLVLE